MESHAIWTDGIEEALRSIHSNSLLISDYHTQKYYYFKGYQKYFRISIIVFSGINSVFNVGLEGFVSQKIVSVLCCGISLVCSIISSIELFIGIQTIMEKEIDSAKEFYILSTDIFKMLAIDRIDRSIDGKTYLDNIHTKYCNLIQKSEIVNENSKEYKLYIKPFIDNYLIQELQSTKKMERNDIVIQIENNKTSNIGVKEDRKDRKDRDDRDDSHDSEDII